MKKILLILLFGFFLLSCEGDDDICMSGDATPRMKIKFRDTQNRSYFVPQIFVDVDYGSGMKQMIAATNVDSVFIPLRLDESNYTDIRIRNSKDSTQFSSIRVSYAMTDQYVSPACGVKRLYDNVSADLIKKDPILLIQREQTQITNENQTHFYFILDAH